MPRRGSQRRAFTPADWVYRDSVFDDNGTLLGAQGTYNNGIKTLTSGPAGAFGLPLYDSHNFIKGAVDPGGGLPLTFGSQGRAEGSNALILGYEGLLIMRPSTWALGSNVVVGLRFGVFEQDAGSGLFLVDPAYSMFTSGANLSLAASAWANSRTWVEERRIYRTFNAEVTSPVFSFFFRRRCRRRLRPNEAFGIFAEANNQAGTVGSVTVLITTWFRTLVSDDSG